MNHEEVLSVLPDNKEEAKSIKEIAPAMSLEISSYIDWVRAERRLVRALGALVKWSWVACEERQKEDGHKFWCNAYWKTELVKQELVLHNGSAAIRKLNPSSILAAIAQSSN